MTLFVLICIVLYILALLFVLPRLILERNYKLSFAVGIAIGVMAYSIYALEGAYKQLPDYYNDGHTRQRVQNQQMRPFYAKIQREIIKSELNIAIDLNNIDLILDFATIHSQQMDGRLQAKLKNLLLALLKQVPQQITAMNLLAIDAYRAGDFETAASYWQRIVDQMPQHLRGSEAEKVLKNKIAQMKAGRPTIAKPNIVRKVQKD